MKKAMLLAVAVLLVAGSAFALRSNGLHRCFQGCDTHTDVGGNSICPAQYGQFRLGFGVLPSENGLQAAEFAVSFPATIIVSATVKNPGITVELG